MGIHHRPKMHAFCRASVLATGNFKYHQDPLENSFSRLTNISAKNGGSLNFNNRALLPLYISTGHRDKHTEDRDTGSRLSQPPKHLYTFKQSLLPTSLPTDFNSWPSCFAMFSSSGRSWNQMTRYDVASSAFPTETREILSSRRTMRLTFNQPHVASFREEIRVEDDFRTNDNKCKFWIEK